MHVLGLGPRPRQGWLSLQFQRPAVQLMLTLRHNGEASAWYNSSVNTMLEYELYCLMQPVVCSTMPRATSDELQQHDSFNLHVAGQAKSHQW